MTGWQTFWICLCILMAAPSMSDVVKQLKRIADTLEAHKGKSDV